MSQVGYQDFWVTGSRAYFQRDAIESAVQPWIDLGRITPVSPSLTPTTVELIDRDGGIGSVVDQALTQIEEVYEITCSNLNMDNWALLLLGTAAESFTQSSAEVSVEQYAHPDNILKLVDASGNPVFNYESIFAVTDDGTFDTDTVTDMEPSTRVITTGSDISGNLSVGEHFIVHRSGLANAANARTYSVAAIDGTSVTANENIAAVESSVSVTLSYIGGAGTATIYKQKVEEQESGRDWRVYSTSRGAVEFLTAGTFATAGNLTVHAHTTALSGNRQIKPQAAKGTIQGTMLIYFPRKGGAYESVRQMTVSLTPTGGAFSDEDFSNFTLSARVLNDLLAEDPAGLFISSKGSLPTRS